MTVRVTSRSQTLASSGMELVRYTEADFTLTEALETDPEVMRELGGPTDTERLPDLHRSRLTEPWYLTIRPEPEGPAVGTIGIWEKELDGATIHETGWMVLPAFQDRGIASRALTLLIERAHEAPQLRAMHAFPPVTNAPSNALCRKCAFTLLGERDFVYAGRTLRCNHWVLELASS
jgi:RimJ/RimL family protein N-acetyltransferase